MNTQTPTKRSIVDLGKPDIMQAFKKGCDNLIAKRAYFMSQVFPKLKEGHDYHIIKGKKSLSKGGAEKLSACYNYSAFFEQDTQTMTIFSNIKGLIAFVCTLYTGPEKVGQGRGSSTLTKNDEDPNKAIKMAQKSAYIDAVIRTSGLSDIFTQDLETMPSEKIIDLSQSEEMVVEENLPAQDPITCRQMDLCKRLLNETCDDGFKRQQAIEQLNDLTKVEASKLIQSLIEKREMA